MLFPSFRELTAWELRYVVGSWSTNEDLVWARANIKPELKQRDKVGDGAHMLGYNLVNKNGVSVQAGAIVFVALSAVSIVKSCAAVPSEIVKGVVETAKGLGQAFQPKITVNKTLALAIGALDSKFEFKVGERAIDVVVEKTSETEWMGVPVGKTVTRLRVLGNRVQYIVPLSNISPEQDWTFVGSDSGGALLVTLPAPTVDLAMVSIQTDPAKIQLEVDDQWLNNVFFWQSDSQDEARHMIRDEVAKQAGARAFILEVEQDAAPRIEALLQSTLQASLRPNVQVKVIWKH